MLTTEQIKSLISNGEGYNIEFKVNVPNKVKELSQEICAFANSNGGYIFIGVDDYGNIIGVNIDNSKRSAIQDSIRDISPILKVDMYNLTIDTKSIWIIEIPCAENKPYLLSGAIYVREGANSQKITSVDEIRAFFQRSNRIYFDNIPCEEYNPEIHFDQESFNEFCELSSISNNITPEQILNNIQICGCNNIIKNGGVMFFAKEPEKFFPQAITRCVLFKGTSRVHIIDDKSYSGSLYHQYRQADAWLKDKLKVSYIIEGSGPRKEVWEIPLEVFKEALINALSHRDYYECGANIMVEVYDDRVEITNPGGLLSEVAKEFGTKSITRNPLIMGLFTRMHLVERVASGIPRMRDAMSKAGLAEPTFKSDGFFTVTFPRPNYNPNLSGHEPINEPINEQLNIDDLLLSYISNKEGISMIKLNELTGKSSSTIKRSIARLKIAEKIEYRGSKKTGGYYICNKNNK